MWTRWTVWTAASLTPSTTPDKTREHSIDVELSHNEDSLNSGYDLCGPHGYLVGEKQSLIAQVLKLRAGSLPAPPAGSSNSYGHGFCLSRTRSPRERRSRRP